MRIRADIAELLRAGCSNREVAHRLNTSPRHVAAARTALGLPRHPPGPKSAGSPQDLFRKHTHPVAGGHLEWTGRRNDDGLAVFCWGGRNHTAARVAFVMHHGRQPVGNVKAGCGVDGCVTPAHMEDQPMRAQLRTQLASIFGGAA
ncbi:hypothetical protein [Streptomyces sp. NPDC057509]|uniref:hypothetical protein n=1 Tax=Streptomyces sp. NPDC057509 TaxID=3346152 RepID=UPI0036B5DF17